MLKAIIAFVIVLGLAAPFARATAWQWAFVATMPFPAYDEERIYRQIKGRVLSRAWAASAIVGACAVAAAMLATEDYLALLLIGFGVILMVSVWSFRAHALFRVAMSELSLPWPPSSLQS